MGQLNATGNSESYRAGDASTYISNGQNTFDPPYVIILSGHAGAGKDTLRRSSGAHFSEKEFPHRMVPNYKSRDPRSTEVAGVDFLPITSQSHYERLVKLGKIVAPYKHLNRLYGISGEFQEALRQGESPIMITDPDGLYNLSQYARTVNLQNLIVSILLHTGIREADRRLIARAQSPLSAEEIEEINARRRGLPREFELYRGKEDMFRYVFKNDGGQGEQESIDRLVNRASELIRLEPKLGANSPADFREAYVNHVVEKLFNTSLADLTGSTSQGILLSIPQSSVDALADDYKLNPRSFDDIRRQPIIAAVDGHGILSLYFHALQSNEEKAHLISLIERSVGLTSQYRNMEIEFRKESKPTLKETVDRNGDYLDFAVSFSAYDPMRAPQLNSRIHTIAFEGAMTHGEPKIGPVSRDTAKRIIEGNGS